MPLHSYVWTGSLKLPMLLFMETPHRERSLVLSLLAASTKSFISQSLTCLWAGHSPKGKPSFWVTARAQKLLSIFIITYNSI